MALFGGNNKAAPTQNFVPLQSIHDDVVIMKDGSMRAVIMTSSSNFSLKSSDERSSIIYQFQNFLNSLDFSVQIYVQSRRLAIEPYLETLQQRLNLQENPLLRTQIEEYIVFIKDFAENVNIMRKSFFVVVPYTPIEASVSKATKTNKTDEVKALQDKRFAENRSQLMQRVGVVSSGLTRCGVRVATLGKEELRELYEHIFNPDQSAVAIVE